MTRIEFKITVIVDSDDEVIAVDKIEEQILYDLPRYIPFNDDDVYSVEGYELEPWCPLPDVEESVFCLHCGKLKRLPGNGIMNQLCECGKEPDEFLPDLKY